MALTNTDLNKIEKIVEKLLDTKLGVSIAPINSRLTKLEEDMQEVIDKLDYMRNLHLDLVSGFIDTKHNHDDRIKRLEAVVLNRNAAIY